MDLAPLLKKYKLTVTPEVQEKITHHIRILVVNICSMLAALTQTYNQTTKKVTPQIIKQSLEYVKSVCYPELLSKKGGSYVIDGEYFGANSSAYTESATEKNLSQTIDFQNNLARPQVGGCGCAGVVQAGGAADYTITEFTEMVLEERGKTTFMGIEMLPYFEVVGVTISDSSLEIVKQVLRMHLHCLFYDLQKVKGKLTVKKLEEVMAKKAHSVFN